MDRDAIARTAALLGAARLASAGVPDVAPEDAPSSAADAYEVQSALHAYLESNGQGTPAGWKIGATTDGMQRYLGVVGPASGRVFDANIYTDGAALLSTAFCQPGIECEIAVRIGRDADARIYDREMVGDLIDGVLPAIEIVENRYGDFLGRGTPTLIADDFFHKAAVLGTERSDWRRLDLAALRGRTSVDGIGRGTGTGADVLGHPLEAVAWLANAVQERGEYLSAGEIVLTGSLPPVIWLEDFPARAEIDIEALGRVTVSFD